MSLFRRDPEPAERPPAHTIVDTPTTVADCATDYDNRHQTTNPHPSSYNAQPHTYSH